MTCGHPPVVTKRLVLSQIASSDADNLQRAADVYEIADTMISIPHPYPPGEAVRYIERQQAEARDGKSVTFTIRQKKDDTFAGIVEVRAIDTEHYQAELSFWLAVGVWGNGFMKETIEAVVNYAFQSLQVNRLYAYHMLRNPASGKVLERNGFTKEGVLRERVWKHDRFEDVAIWAILRRDWKSRAAT